MKMLQTQNLGMMCHFSLLCRGSSHCPWAPLRPLCRFLGAHRLLWLPQWRCRTPDSVKWARKQTERGKNGKSSLAALSAAYKNQTVPLSASTLYIYMHPVALIWARVESGLPLPGLLTQGVFEGRFNLIKSRLCSATARILNRLSLWRVIITICKN